MNRLAVVIFLFWISYSVSAQSNLKQMLTAADSIRLISHSTLEIRSEDGGIDWKKIVDSTGVADVSVIKEQVTLTASALKKLIHLLTHPGKPSNFANDVHKIFEPRQAILIYKNGKCSYIDICFPCIHYDLSEDIVDNEDFLIAKRDWEQLRRFFQEQGIRYELPEYINVIPLIALPDSDKKD